MIVFNAVVREDSSIFIVTVLRKTVRGLVVLITSDTSLCVSRLRLAC